MVFYDPSLVVFERCLIGSIKLKLNLIVASFVRIERLYATYKNGSLDRRPERVIEKISRSFYTRVRGSA